MHDAITLEIRFAQDTPRAKSHTHVVVVAILCGVYDEINDNQHFKRQFKTIANEIQNKAARDAPKQIKRCYVHRIRLEFITI